MDAALLFIKFRGFEVSSWGTKPFSIENEVGAPNLSSGLNFKGLRAKLQPLPGPVEGYRVKLQPLPGPIYG